MDIREELNVYEDSIYKFTAIVGEIECMDDECVIFDIKNMSHLPTKHCFVKNKILADTLVVIVPEAELEVSARFMPEKNCMDIIELKELGVEKKKTIVTRYKINPVDSDCYLYQVKKQIKEPFEILLNNTPATLSHKCKSEVPLIECRQYEFTYEKKANKLEVIKIASVDNFFGHKNFVSAFASRHVTRMNHLYEAGVLVEDDKKINSFNRYVDLCVSKTAGNPGMVVGFTGTVCKTSKEENDISFYLELSNEVRYKCIIINSEYSNDSIKIQEGKGYYVSGILSNGVIYVLISQRLREAKKRRPFITLDRIKQKANKKEM